MKNGKGMCLTLAVAFLLCAVIAFVGCESTAPTSTETPDLRDKPFDADGIRVNGTESCGKCGEVHQLWAVGYGEQEKHFCTRDDAQTYLDISKNGAN